MSVPQADLFPSQGLHQGIPRCVGTGRLNQQEIFHQYPVVQFTVLHKEVFQSDAACNDFSRNKANGKRISMAVTIFLVGMWALACGAVTIFLDLC